MSERIKATVRDRDGHRCTQCGMTARRHRRRYGRTLHVHRLLPGGPYTLEGCVTLCVRCHGDKPKSPVGSVPSQCQHPRLAFHLPADFLAFIDSVAEELGRTRTTEVVRRLKEAYQAAGLWPPKASP
jgi:hypothetical protein